MKKIIVLFLFLGIFLTGCKKYNNYEGHDNPIVTMEIENYGTIKMELYPEYATNTVANFVNLVESGFYNNNSFHRLMKGFVLQGGDPKGTGNGGPGYRIKGEFKNNVYTKNTLSHTEGIVSMARAKGNDTAGSQFFIVLDDSAKRSLDDRYAGFGKVIEGMDVIKNIEATGIVEDSKTGKLLNNITITKATVETFGVNYRVTKI